MPARRRWPWDQMRAAYVEGEEHPTEGVHYPTLDEIADRQGCRRDTVHKRSAAEHWPELRKQHQRRLEQLRAEERAKMFLATGMAVDSSALELANAGLRLTQVRVQELIEGQRQRNTDLRANPRGRPSVGPLQARELQALSLAGIRWHQLAMRALGQETDRGPVLGSGEDAAAYIVTDEERRLAETVQSRIANAIEARVVEPPDGDADDG